jgi:hypothetical protein
MPTRSRSDGHDPKRLSERLREPYSGGDLQADEVASRLYHPAQRINGNWTHDPRPATKAEVSAVEKILRALERAGEVEHYVWQERDEEFGEGPVETYWRYIPSDQR